MPKNATTWSAWNFLGATDKKVCLTYWLNIVQKCITETELPLLVTFNQPIKHENTLLKWSKSHPIPSVAASKASFELNAIQGKRGIWFCRAYLGNGFHGDGLKGGTVVAHSVLGKICSPSRSIKPMVPSLTEIGARLFVTRFLKSFITMGSLTKEVATQTDFGFPEEYKVGDISFVEKNGLENFFEVSISTFY
ncbi:hypothetical protein GIB67_026409, partial [Kingdonia uniflora]